MDFHEDAKAAYSRQAQELLGQVKMYPTVIKQPTVSRFDIHPTAVISASEIIGTPKFTESIVNALGHETGRFWTLNGQKFGWTEEAYLSMQKLAKKIQQSKPMRGLVGEGLVLDLLFEWLCKNLEQVNNSDPIDYIVEKIGPTIKNHEFCIPLHNVFSTRPVTIGPVLFKTMTREWFDATFPSNISREKDMAERVEMLENQTRAAYQGKIGAWILVQAEENQASRIALRRVTEACSLLRFISIANWTSEIRSYATPLGLEAMSAWHSLRPNDGRFTGFSSEALPNGPTQWVLDDVDNQLFTITSALSDLYSNQNSAFRRELLEAFLIYSRNSTTSSPADKLLFIIVALESLLLKDASEPIQGNLAERMAFLIGQTLAERKDIVANVRKTYAMRSKFVHHGMEIDDEETLNRFLLQSWSSLLEMLNRRNRYKSRLEMLTALDEIKLS